MNTITTKTKPGLVRHLVPEFNRRQRTLVFTSIAAFFLGSILVGSALMGDDRIATSLLERNLLPSLAHPFGTDWLGRDMFVRTIKGLSLSIRVGLLAAGSSVLIALLLGMAAATMGRYVDAFVSWLIDLFLGVPHLVALILISFTLGGGAKGVIIGVALTHWTSLARVIRAEILQLRTAHYISASRNFGKSRWWVATRHMLPHILPQLFVGLILVFPHAILHEASITFLGFGLSPHQPAIGIILSESMKYLSQGMWWLAVFPGLVLVAIVRAFDVIGENLRLMIDPYSAQD